MSEKAANAHCDAVRANRALWSIEDRITAAYHTGLRDGQERMRERCAKECAHKNGNKTDNRPGNLRWTTKLENEADKVSHGTSSRGQGNGNAKLTENSIVKIRSALLSGEMQRCLAKRFGVAQQTISDIKRRIKWNTTAAYRRDHPEES